MMRLLTWDTGILAALGLLLAYSLLIRKHKSLATLVSVYVGYVMATVWGDQVAAFFAGDRVFLSQVWIRANASPFVVKAVLMIGVAFLLSSFIKLGGRRSKYSAPEVTVYAVATLALAVSLLVTFMAPEMRAQVLASSQIVPFIYRWNEWFTVLPIFAIIFFGIYGNEDV